MVVNMVMKMVAIHAFPSVVLRKVILGEGSWSEYSDEIFI
jgi:hypothetical protein